ncbi:hypothetical protein Asp14428_75160 [Actinoplanes sp. NBRC 14428]|uniref:Uncharacterized protein n=1 Tax=Pseudosporangium ferrugineum TaxID=439699 RepID=A0A2T0RJH4_9ACTN|nr:hypothetical protein [Pseudosporangium ferrugineum]PRY21344.1 hypothetical protein CLV70_12054 [Pseudosporangium ferrugineum]BCJ56041.1 hypothetical protein Asp14428_75160 [Actinoplanes sp. NBRC 14428]
MTPDDSVRVTAARLSAVDWRRHGYRSWSKAKLMLEYFRRMAQWAEAYGCDEPVPFFDLAQYVDPNVRADPAVVDEAVRLAAEGGWNAQQVVPFILHWAAVRAAPGVVFPEGLEDPFEPLLLLFERDGGFHTSNGFVEMEFLSVPLAKWRQRASRPPLAGMDAAALDEVDRAGSVRQFGYVMGPEG